MKILLFHPVSMPPRDYGGVERVVLWLAKGLRDLGHEVWIGALEGSHLPEGVRLWPIRPDQRSAGALAENLPPGLDLIHFQAPPELDFFQKTSIPSVTTIHGNGKPGEIFPEATVFLSADHAYRHGRKTYVYNGVDPEEFRLSPKSSRAEPLFLSKTTLRTKNLRGALRIARELRSGLTIAGGHRPLALRLRAWRHGYRWVGPVNGEKKARCLAEASTLFFPVAWDEPFGLVMVEAMLSGTPVLGTRRGSIPEVLGDKGGIALDLPDEEPAGPHEAHALVGLVEIDQQERAERIEAWRAAYAEVRKWDPVALRTYAIERFSHHQMAEAYLSVYKKVLRGEPL